VVGPQTLAPSLIKPQPRSLRLGATLIADDRMCQQLLREMRRYSGVGTKLIARRMGVKPETIRQYFKHNQPSLGGQRTTIGFLCRFAEACGCRVVVHFPDREQKE
jgi:hypothetical protein